MDFRYEYTDHYDIVALPGPVRLPLADESLASIVRASAEAIIAANSNFKKAEIDALSATWDGEVRLVSK